MSIESIIFSDLKTQSLFRMATHFQIVISRINQAEALIALVKKFIDTSIIQSQPTKPAAKRRGRKKKQPEMQVVTEER